MNDKELADRIVALGVAARADDGDSIKVYDYTLNQFYWFTPRQAVRDWRVAGALMEKCVKDKRKWYDFSQTMLHWNHYEDAELLPTMANPRAICEACVAALEGDDE